MVFRDRQPVKLLLMCCITVELNMTNLSFSHENKSTMGLGHFVSLINNHWGVNDPGLVQDSVVC